MPVPELIAGAPDKNSVTADNQLPGTAYATFIVPQDDRPYIYRTQDGGATWRKIVSGLP